MQHQDMSACSLATCCLWCCSCFDVLLAARPLCRIAIEHQAALVPVLALGENLQLRNLLDLPGLQQYTYKKLGFPVPFILVGRWGVTPFPRRVPLLYVVGRPLQPPPHLPGQAVDPDSINKLHRQYYASLVDLFERYKHLHPEFAEASVALAND